MAEPFIGEIRMFAGTFAPKHWAFCNGQLLSIAEYQALCSLIGTYYGGDGISTFALPDLRGRLPMDYGSGPGLTPRIIGTRFGYENVPLSLDQTPKHTHGLMVANAIADKTTPTGNSLAVPELPAYGPKSADTSRNVQLADTAMENTGGSQPHSNLMPSLCVNFIIALQGYYPSRN